MIQITTNIANGNVAITKTYNALNQCLVDRHLELGFDPAHLVIVTDCAGYDQKATVCVQPLPHDHFNFRIRHWNYIHAINQLGLKDQELLLRDSDTVIMKKFDFPVHPGYMGLVRWHLGNMNCGGIYVGKGALDHYLEMINLLPETYDEKWISKYVRGKKFITVLSQEYNYDLRIGPCEGVLMAHFCRRFWGDIPPDIKDILGRYNLDWLPKRGQEYFGKYGDK